MKQIVQNYKEGSLKLIETAPPLCKKREILVENKNSLISAGTEKLMIGLAKKSLLGKAKERPDLVKKVIRKIKTDGFFEAYKQSMARLEKSVPLGYSSAGVVKKTGENISEFKAGDKVACAGFEHASHAEIVAIPKNLSVKIPNGVSFEEASFVTLGAIALHAVRTSKAKIGESVVVIGLGLLGQIAIQILKAAGCNVLGADVSPEKIKIARGFGADETALADNLIEKSNQFTEGKGVDAVIIFASTKSNQPIEQAAKIARERGKIIAPGMIALNLPRKIFYEKELELIVSRSSGPGIYDKQYEEKGVDYPISYVRWTEKRNMKSFLDLVSQKKINLKPLITHRFKFENALSAYDMILQKKEKYIGVVLEYSQNEAKFKNKIKLENNKPKTKKGVVNVGLIGAGLFVKGTLSPILNEIKGINLKGLAVSRGHSGHKTAQKLGFDYITTDYNKILNDEAIDAILIATPHNTHAKFITESLEAKKDVFCEKPLCINSKQLEQIIKAYKSSGKQLMVGFNRRFSPFSTFLKEKLNPNTPMVINCRVNVGHIPKESWTHDPEVGGGNIIGEVCHFVDLIQYLTGSLPQKVSAFSIDSPKDNIVLEDNIAINIKLRNGSIANIVYTAFGNKSFPRERIEVFSNGEVGTIDNFKKSVFFGKKTKKTKRGFGMNKGHKKEYKTFFNSLKQGKEIPVDFKEYVATTLTTFAITESIKNKGEQKIEWN